MSLNSIERRAFLSMRDHFSEEAEKAQAENDHVATLQAKRVVAISTTCALTTLPFGFVLAIPAAAVFWHKGYFRTIPQTNA